MKKYLYLLLSVFFVSLITACETDEWKDEVFTVEVIGKGMSCGDLYLIKFLDEEEQDVYKYVEETNAYFPIFYAVNLPEEYKLEGICLNISLNECSAKDAPGCLTFGPGYGHVCISSAEPLNKVVKR